MKLRKTVAILLGLVLLGQGIWFVTTHISSFYFVSCLEKWERIAGELLLPSVTILGEKGPEKSFTDQVLEATLTPWYYEEARSYVNGQIRTQENEAYLQYIIENDSTDYYQLMKEENETAEDMGNSEATTDRNNLGVAEAENPEDAGKSESTGKPEDTGKTENAYNPEQEDDLVEQKGEESGEEKTEDVQESEGVGQYDFTGDLLINPREEKQYHYEQGVLEDYEKLVKAFYIIDENTKAGPDKLDAATFEKMDFTVPKHTEEPVILIYHTHSKEDFCNSREGVTEDTVVGAGRYLAALLEAYGYRVLHDETSFDSENRDYAYSNALPHVEKLLKENPQIQVVIDLHRDEMPEETHLVSEVDGKRCARYMFFNGMSRLKEKGEISYLENPFREENLGFSFQLQKASNEYYPGLARRIYLKAYRYNLHLRPASVLIELGAQNNTVEEIMNGCVPLAQVLDLVLGGE